MTISNHVGPVKLQKSEDNHLAHPNGMHWGMLAPVLRVCEEEEGNMVKLAR